MKHARKLIVALPLAIAAAASAMLVWQRFTGHRLPGCGPQSACASLAESGWGQVLGVPLSVLGFAYFVAMLVGVMITRRSRWLTVTLMLGAAVSVFYLGLMIWLQRLCGYCIAVHVANLITTVLACWHARGAESGAQDSSPRSRGNPNLAPGITIAVFVALLAVLLTLDRNVQNQIASEQARELNRSVDRVLSPEPTEIAELNKTIEPDEPSQGLVGRHVSGDLPAAVRLVLFLDYQCGDCIELESELAELRREHESIAVSMFQFPLCSECNPSIPYPWFHTRACDAARLAEAVHVVGGDAAFAAAHAWLLERKAKYETDDVRSLCQDLGIDHDEVSRLMHSDQVTQTLRGDVSTGISLGVTETPFVFLNGVELKGIALDSDQIREAVERVLGEQQRREAAGEPSLVRSFADDPRPPTADQRVLQLWEQAEPAPSVPPRGSSLIQLGNPDSDQRVLLFMEPTYADAAAMTSALRGLADRRDDVSIELFLYPMNAADNPELPEWQQKLYPHSAIASRAVVALSEMKWTDRLHIVFEVTGPEIETESQWIEAFAERLGAVDDDRNVKPLSIEQWKQRLSEPGLSKVIDAQVSLAKDHDVAWGPTLIIDGKLSPTDRITAALLDQMLGQ